MLASLLTSPLLWSCTEIDADINTGKYRDLLIRELRINIKPQTHSIAHSMRSVSIYS